jgi:hypothetical protein
VVLTVAKQTQCPSCQARHEFATGIGAETPDEGDRTLCIRCGEISIFDRKAWGGLRKPNATEREENDHDPRVFDIRRAWFEGVRDKIKWPKKLIG